MSRPLLTTRQLALPLALGLAMPLMSGAQTAGTATGSTPTTNRTTTTANDRLAASYAQWAGSASNAQSLVNGLRTGGTVNLRSGTDSTSFSPSTGKMGVGEVGIALSLAKAALAQQGITRPTPAQISAALNGGTITSSTGTRSVPGVLSQRSTGMGWGQIAQSLGVKLGAVVSASKTDKTKASHGTKSGATHHSGSAEGHNGGHESHGGGDHGGGGKK